VHQLLQVEPLLVELLYYLYVEKFQTLPEHILSELDLK
jgi:hypothetical protein